MPSVKSVVILVLVTIMAAILLPPLYSAIIVPTTDAGQYKTRLEADLWAEEQAAKIPAKVFWQKLQYLLIFFVVFSIVAILFLLVLRRVFTFYPNDAGQYPLTMRPGITRDDRGRRGVGLMVHNPNATMGAGALITANSIEQQIPAGLLQEALETTMRAQQVQLAAAASRPANNGALTPLVNAIGGGVQRIVNGSLPVPRESGLTVGHVRRLLAENNDGVIE